MHQSIGYIQKSHLILYPLLGLDVKTKFKPVNTFISYKGIEPEDCKLICLYKTKYDEAFYNFRNEVLKQVPIYESLTLTFENNIVVFNLSEYKKDFMYFINGKYSKLSKNVKNKIRAYYSHDIKAVMYIDTHLEPEVYHDYFAELYGVQKEIIQHAFETLSPPDLTKETLIL